MNPVTVQEVFSRRRIQGKTRRLVVIILIRVSTDSPLLLPDQPHQLFLKPLRLATVLITRAVSVRLKKQLTQVLAERFLCEVIIVSVPGVALGGPVISFVFTQLL